MDVNEVVERLRGAVGAAGGVVAWSRENGVPASVVSDTLGGKRKKPTPQILTALGIGAVTDYQPISQEAQ